MPTTQNNSYFKVAYFQVAGPVQSSNTTNSLFRTLQQLFILLALNLGSYCNPSPPPQPMLLFKRAGVRGRVLTLDPIGPLSPGPFPDGVSRITREGEAWSLLFLSFHFLLSTSHIWYMFTCLVHGKERSLRKRTLFCSLLCSHPTKRHSKLCSVNCEQGGPACCPSRAYCLEG